MLWKITGTLSHPVRCCTVALQHVNFVWDRDVDSALYDKAVVLFYVILLMLYCCCIKSCFLSSVCATIQKQDFKSSDAWAACLLSRLQAVGKHVPRLPPAGAQNTTAHATNRCLHPSPTSLYICSFKGFYLYLIKPLPKTKKRSERGC